MTNIGGLIFQAFLITVYFLLFKTEIWGKVSPYLAGIICGYLTSVYIQDFHPGALKHPHVRVPDVSPSSQRTAEDPWNLPLPVHQYHVPDGSFSELH